jgi:streptogramin lyase
MLLTAREERFDIALSLGHGPALVDELDRLVAAEPLRERLRAQQMLALYQAGRQADALASYREARRRFADELGLDPSPELQDLEREILRQDPALNPPTRPQKSAPRRRKARRALAGILLVALAGALGLILALDRSTGPAKPRSLPTESLGALDPATGALHAALPLDAIPAAVTVGGDRVWVAAEQKRTLSEVNPRRLRIVNSVGLPAVPPHELVYGGGAIWATNGFDGTISRIGRDGLISPPFRPEADATGRLALGFGNGSLWVGSQDNVLSRLDPATGKLLATLHVVVTPESVTVGSGSVWVAQATRVDLLRIDARANRITHRIPLGGTATAVTTGDGSVWALTPSQNKLWRIDPRTNAVTAAIDVGAAPSTVVGDDSDVWVASEATGTLNRIDPRNDRIAQTVNLEHPLAGIALKYGRLWVATR